MDSRYLGGYRQHLVLVVFVLTAGVSGQTFSVSIVVNPNVALYTVGDNLMLTCMVDPMPNSNVTLIYAWNCTDCFANGSTSSMITQVLTNMDTIMISCSATINGIVYRSDVFDLQVTQVPTPTVSVTAPNTQTVGQSLTLLCEVTTVRGITSRVDIVWSSGGTELQRMNNVSSTMMSNSLVYTNSYTISQLSTTDDGRVIQCEVVINTSPPVMAHDSTTLDGTVPRSSIMISQSVDSPNVGDDLTLTCTVTVASGVSSPLVMVNWNSQDSILPSSSISNTSINGLQYTRTITFLPLLSSNSGQYNCSGSVNGFDEASNSDSIIVEVNGLPVVTVMPSSQSVEVTHTATFTTMVTGVGSDDFTYQWRHNGTVISGEANNALIITNVMENNTGMYNCTVMNQYGDINSSVALLVVTVTPPVITMHPISKTIELFTNFTNHTLICEVEGALSYNWERQNVVIPSDSTGVNTNALTLINLQPEDAGNYRCVATNASGSNVSNYANLIINVPPPRIIVQPVDKTIPPAQSATFVCVGQGYGFVDVSWGGSRRSLQQRSIITTMITSDNITSMLIIFAVRGRDEGIYRCRYSNSGGITNSDQVRLTIGIPPPAITSHPMDMTVNSGSNVTFNCVSFSYASVNYIWLKDGVALSDDGENIVISNNTDENNYNYTTTLMISDVRLSDIGVYVCNAANSEDTVSSNAATLFVIVRPVFTLHPESNITNEMGRVELSCTATSIAPVMFQWERLINNTWEPFTGSARLIVGSTTDNGTAYTSSISSINIMQSDEGSYRCTASNSAGTNISDVATITVYGRPMIVFLSNDTTVVEGESVSFVCEANNDRNATINVTIRWFGNNGQGLSHGNDRVTITNTMETGPNGTVMSILTIDPVIHQDAGQYRCEALNHPDLTVSRTTELTVEFAPIVTIVTMDKINQSEVNVTLNDIFNMTCEVKSHPLPMVHWEVNGEQVSNKTLVIVDTSDRGAIDTYTCVAVNEVNGTNHSANNSIDVIIQAIPDVIPTDDIAQSKRTVTTVVVQWKKPNDYNAPITMYELDLCQKLEDTSQNLEDSCTSVNDYPLNITVDNASIVRHNITGLKPFIISSLYQLTIRAINDIGPADFSEPVPIILVNRMEAAVQNLTLTPLNNSEVRATWDVNPDLFELNFFNVSYFIKPEQQETDNVTVNTYQISDLIPGETYRVQVTAYYNGTPADTTEETVTLAKIDLTPPTEATLVPPVNNNDPAILRWIPPNLTDENREFFQGYDVSFDRAVLDRTLSGRRKRNVLGTETQTQRIGPNETSYNYNIICPYNTSFTLCPYSRYLFSVISVFAFGNIPIDTSELARVDISTDEAAPNGPPQELNYTSIGIREIDIRWNFPEFPNGVITAFTVYFNDAVQPVLSLNCDISTLSCSTTIGSLDPYVLYSIQVSCSTGAGEGPRTNTISVKTLIGRPEPISNLIVTVSKLVILEESTSITIIQPRFSEANGRIGQYYVVMMNVTESSSVPPDTVSDDQLKPYGGPESFVYVAAVLTSDEYDPSQPYALGSFTSTFFEGVTYINTPLTVGRYHCFVRAFTVGPRLAGNSQLSDQFEITSQSTSPEGSQSNRASSSTDDNSIVVAILATLLIILLIVTVVCVIFILILLRKLKNSVSKHEISSSPQGGLKATEQKLPRLLSDYEEPPSSTDKDKVDPIYEDVEASAQQAKDVAASDVKMEDNPAYDTSVL